MFQVIVFISLPRASNSHDINRHSSEGRPHLHKLLLSLGKHIAERFYYFLLLIENCMICHHIFHGIYSVPSLLRTVGNAFSSSSLGLKVLSSPMIVGSLLLTINRAPKCMVMVFIRVTSAHPSCNGSISPQVGVRFPVQHSGQVGLNVVASCSLRRGSGQGK